MLEIAEQVHARLLAGRPVTIVRLIETQGFSSRDRDHIVAVTPGEAVLGSLLSGALDQQLPEAIGSAPAPRSVIDLAVSDARAGAAGLSCGGVARLLVHPADDIDDDGWTALRSGEPVCLVTDLDPEVGETVVFAAATLASAQDRYGPGIRRMFVRGATQTTVLNEAGSRQVVTALWPVPALVIIGGGQIADALAAVAHLLGWIPQIVEDAATAAAAPSRLRHADAVVVLSHDRTLDAPALQAALSSTAGYVGGLGSARTQSERARWLTDNGTPAADIARIHGPAGLDVGANTPAEIAIAITAEILAVRSGTGGGSLQGRLGPIRPT
jgi:xanthine dehydrogenase accessory factor